MKKHNWLSKPQKNAGFDNINVDLMFGLPSQTIDDALADLNMGIDLNPKHISWYQLTIEPNTVFYSKKPQLPNDDYIWEVQKQGQQLLCEHNYEQYEISSYCRNNQTCKHNLNYWHFGDYLGIGAGAHSKLTKHSTEVSLLHPLSIKRVWKLKQPDSYLKAEKKQYIAGEKTLMTNELPLEFMMNALRLKDGVDVKLFEQNTGLDLSHIQHTLAQCYADGLLYKTDYRIKTTEKGFLFLNEVLQSFQYS